MMRVFMTMLCSLLTVCSVSAQISRQEGTDGQAAIYRLPLMERAFLCCRYFEGWHSEKHYPYVGWGHKLLPNEKYSARTMTKRDADELLRKDLRKFVAMFRKFGVDSLLLSEISDNKIESFPNCWNIAQNFRRSFRRSASACRFVMVRAEYLSPGCNRCPYPTYG